MGVSLEGDEGHVASGAVPYLGWVRQEATAVVWSGCSAEVLASWLSSLSSIVRRLCDGCAVMQSVRLRSWLLLLIRPAFERLRHHTWHPGESFCYSSSSRATSTGVHSCWLVFVAAHAVAVCAVGGESVGLSLPVCPA
jgi:hypothetical protein